MSMGWFVVMQRLVDKVAIVTGSGQGIGKGLALRLAAEGSHVAVVDMNYENGKAVASEIERMGRKALAFEVNVTNSEAVERMVEAVVSRFGRIDILVNNAGIIKAGFIVDLPEETWDAIIAVNLKGCFLCTRAVAKHMVEQRSGRIVNISSKSGKKGGLWLAAYCASKFGIIGLTQSVAFDLAPFGINVNAVCPGNIFETPMWDQLDKEYSAKLGIPPEQVRAKYVEKVPLGRSASLEDVANVVVFLCSDEASYMTGQAINVTGGQEMR